MKRHRRLDDPGLSQGPNVIPENVDGPVVYLGDAERAVPASPPPPPADDARRRTGRLAAAMRGLFGGGDEPGDDAVPPAPRDPARDRFQAVGDFLFQHRLDPRPGNYDLAHQYVTGSNRRLVHAVDDAIARVGRITEEAAELILEECRTDMSADTLAKLVDDAQAGLTSIAGLVRQSGADVQAYGAALVDEAKTLVEGGGAPRPTGLDSLLALTRSMIEKTREAEQQLRSQNKRMGSLRSSLAEARRVATSDPLTGLPNRRAFEEKLKTAVADARAACRPLALAFCDIDHFKNINDTHGHEVGDRILRFVARLLSAASDNTCHVARHGGEEFVMLFEGRTAAEAMKSVDTCREDLASRRLVAKQSGDPIGQVSFSAGVSELCGISSTGRDILRQADRALYRAKAEGRNRVLLARRDE